MTRMTGTTHAAFELARPRRAIVWRAHRNGRTGSALPDDEVMVAVVTVSEVAVVAE